MAEQKFYGTPPEWETDANGRSIGLTDLDGSVVRIASWATDANGNPTGLVGPDGNNVIDVEQPSGNIIAQITPRADTLANLLLVADAGVGEIASATDVPAIVKYLGNPSVGKAYYMSKEAGYLYIAFPAITIPTATDTTMTFTSASVDTFGCADAANDWFVMPSSGINAIEINATINFPAGAGTYRKVAVEYDVTGGGVWLDIVNPEVKAAVGSLVTSVTISKAVYASDLTSSYGGKRVRIRAKQDSGGDLAFCTGILSLKSFNR